jgi:hypothetical protein
MFARSPVPMPVSWPVRPVSRSAATKRPDEGSLTRKRLDKDVVALTSLFERERVTGIEPAFSAWEADVLPLNYTREEGQR